MLLLNPFLYVFVDMTCVNCVLWASIVASILYHVFCMASILYHQFSIMDWKTKVKRMQPCHIFSLFRSNQIKSEGGASDLLYFQYNLAKSAKLNSSTSSAPILNPWKIVKDVFFQEKWDIREILKQNNNDNFSLRVLVIKFTRSKRATELFLKQVSGPNLGQGQGGSKTNAHIMLHC